MHTLSAYAGKILLVDLSTGKVVKSPLPEHLVKKYVGGKGLGTRLLYDEVPPRINPLAPENKMVITTGPATGTIVPNKGYCVCFKSPLTNIYASSSSGGSFGAELKRAGYDVLIVGGRSKKPVYLWIDDERVQVKDAKHLWGRDTFETDVMVKEELGDEGIKVARIGPAGEKLVTIANITNDYSRSAGRGGAGSVMGSKNLKAIAVRGTKHIEVAKMDELLEFVGSWNKTVREKTQVYHQWGTPALVNITNLEGIHPTRYWHKGALNEYEKINAETMKARMVVKNKACNSCVMNCAKLCEVRGGPYSGTIVEGPDYETIYALGSLCENSNLESIAKANELCDKFGIDTISAGNLIAFAMECYERGIITTEDTEGVKLVWGNHEAVVQLVEKIATKTGLGNLLAEGVREAAKRIGKGAEDFAVHVKGLEPAGYDPRGLKGMALAYAIADRGACHLPATIYIFELRGVLDRLAVNGKAAFLKDLGMIHAVGDTLILCRFLRDVYSWETLVKLFPLLMGVETSEAELRGLGERIITLARAFSVREGIGRKDDMLPERFFREPIPEGPSEGLALKKNEFNKMLDEYYELMGWDQNGIPTKERLLKIELADVEGEMETFGKKTNQGGPKHA